MVPVHNLPEFLVTVYVLILIPGICIVIAGLSDAIWAFASGTAREWLGNSPRRLERLTAGGGVALVGLGVGLAITGRKQ
jgi:threonine/homoserine/homoserine lactone efflux protein